MKSVQVFDGDGVDHSIDEQFHWFIHDPDDPVFRFWGADACWFRYAKDAIPFGTRALAEIELFKIRCRAEEGSNVDRYRIHGVKIRARKHPKRAVYIGLKGAPQQLNPVQWLALNPVGQGVIWVTDRTHALRFTSKKLALSYYDHIIGDNNSLVKLTWCDL